MVETKLTGPSMEERIANKLKNSGEGANPDVSVQKGEGPLRTHTNIHHSPNKARGSGGGEGR
jgi:hypothetical protein